MDDIHDGGCQCGQLRYRVEGKPVKAAVCHCRYCQTRTGSAFGVSAYFPREKVSVSGNVKDYSFTTESGRSFTTHFCPTCGTHLVTRLPDRPAVVVKVGTLDDPSFYSGPQMAIFTCDIQPFHVIAEGVPSVEKLPSR